VQQDWVSLAENPTVEILLQVLAELQERVMELEADMVTLKVGQDPWSSVVGAPTDFGNSVKR